MFAGLGRPNAGIPETQLPQTGASENLHLIGRFSQLHIETINQKSTSFSPSGVDLEDRIVAPVITKGTVLDVLEYSK